MKVQFSILVALALLGASMIVQFVDAMVCYDECSVRGRAGVKVCENGKNQCATKRNNREAFSKREGNVEFVLPRGMSV